MSLFGLHRREQIAREIPVKRMNHLPKRFGFSPAWGALIVTELTVLSAGQSDGEERRVCLR